MADKSNLRYPLSGHSGKPSEASFVIYSEFICRPLQGYSHGSLIASLHPILPSFKTSHILLSYPLGPRAWLTMFNSSSYNSALRNLVEHPESNVLVIFGDQDEFTSIAKYRVWASELGGSNLEIREISNASHFWHGRSGRELQGIVSRWLP